RGCFASHLAVPEGLVFAKPKGLGFVDAACLPTAFLTAWHALVTQGRMTAGERVLITAAAGGVGQAAIQIATALGAEIYAAAGRLPQQRPALLQGAMTAIFAGLESGTLRPLPVETFPVSRAADAFRRLSQARHIGKVALVMDEPDAAVALREDRPLALRPDGTY